jgi:hypothetical protein
MKILIFFQKNYINSCETKKLVISLIQQNKQLKIGG